jgi:hypothetical protein
MNTDKHGLKSGVYSLVIFVSEASDYGNARNEIRVPLQSGNPTCPLVSIRG